MPYSDQLEREARNESAQTLVFEASFECDEVYYALRLCLCFRIEGNEEALMNERIELLEQNKLELFSVSKHLVAGTTNKWKAYYNGDTKSLAIDFIIFKLLLKI